MSHQQRLDDLEQVLQSLIEENELFSGATLVRALKELTLTVPRAHLLSVMQVLQRHPGTALEQCIDLCGLDYGAYGDSEWNADGASLMGFSRAKVSQSSDFVPEGRFAVVYHLLSVSLNHRLRVRVLLDEGFPVVDSVTGVWKCTDWFEREAFDMYGILFSGHPDLRRILTDYGFIGHPLRKDFPLVGHVEMRYDADLGRVVYQPVSIEQRPQVPRVIRHDSRYEPGFKPQAGDANG